MISDQDLMKLKETFATKDDLTAYATQDSLNVLAEKVDGIQEELGDLKVEVGELHDKFDTLSNKFDSMESKIDGMVGLLEASLQEHGAGAVHLARHDRQISSLATHVGAALAD